MPTAIAAASALLFLAVLGLVGHALRLVRTLRLRSAEAEQARAQLEREITVRRQVEQVLRRDWELIRSIVETSPAAILMAAKDGSILFSNTRAARILECLADPKSQLPLDEVLRSGAAVNDQRCSLAQSDGCALVLSSSAVPLQDEAGHIEGVVATIQDITARVEVEAQLEHRALHDLLTGLPNRALFAILLGHAIRRTQRHTQYQFAVLLLDADRLGFVHESLGPAAASELLVQLGARLRSCVRSSDILARFDTGEFGILLEDVRGTEDALRVAGRVHRALEQPFELDGHPFFTTASVGIAFSRTPYTEPDQMLRDAGIALARSRELGSGRYEMFDPEMHARSLARLRLENDLRLALERGELLLHYQPIVELDSGRITGFEALLRWKHPHRGLVSPGEFVPVAEQTGLIVPIGEWVLEQACRTLRAWQEQFPEQAGLSLSVNVSGVQLAKAPLVESLARILHQTALDPARLHLELTESVLMHPHAADVLERIQALGVHLALDDFGTGYSSLAYLHRFAFDVLKIDRSFIGRLASDTSGAELVRTIVSLASNLRLQAVAEGVETAEQRAWLLELGCPLAQGYLFSRPLDQDAATRLLAEPPRF